MNRLPLTGCRSEPLGSYLQGLGVWRAVTRLLDAQARAHWDDGVLVLSTNTSAVDLVRSLCERFEPVPIVSPWNAGSGFAANGKSITAERALDSVRSSADPRLARLRAAVLAADDVVTQGRGLGWGGSKDEMWDKAHKADLVRLCRNLLPDDALAWIDAAIVLGQDDDPAYSPLLGTGGNLLRQDLSATYIHWALDILKPQRRSRSEGWLHAALFGDESVPYERGTVGQFDPVRAGGIQASPFEKLEGFVNPWSTLFTLEGALLFASAVVRRLGAHMRRAAVPFQVSVSAIGFASSAPMENSFGEVWTPEWSRPALLAEVEHLLGEGRVEWLGRPARSGLDFACAVSSLGVDRGLTAFTRHALSERLGRTPLAVPVGRIPVQRQRSVGLLAEADPWLGKLREARNLPAGVQARLRTVDSALFAVARGGGAVALRDVIICLGQLHEAVSRSGGLRDKVRPLLVRNAAGWWESLEPDSGELRLAAALASGGDPPAGRRAEAPAATLRLLLTPVRTAGGGRLDWTTRPPLVPWGADVIDALAVAHRRRALPGTVPDPADDPDQPSPAVRGVLSAFGRGMTVPLHDVADLVAGRLDDELLGDYLRGLLLLDWSTVSPGAVNGQARPWKVHDPSLVPPPLALLLPFFAASPLPLRLSEEDLTSTRVVLRPGQEWLASLLASGLETVLTDAVRRLRTAGMTETVAPETLARTRLEGRRLAAALLVRVSRRDRIQALSRAVALPRQGAGSASGATIPSQLIEE